MRSKFLTTVFTCAFLASSCSGGQADADFIGVDPSDIEGEATTFDSNGNPATPSSTNDSEASATSSEPVDGDETDEEVADGETLDRSSGRSGITNVGTTSPEPSSLGAFELTCSVTKEAAFDPLQDGPSPLNFFIGNTDISESSTNDGNAGTDISTAEGSTCPGGRADLSSYWAPAMYEADGTVVRPDWVRIVYGRSAHDGTKIQAPPIGINAISGDRDASSAQSPSTTLWNCVNEDGSHSPGFGADATSLIPDCSSGQDLVLQQRFNTCLRESDSPVADLSRGVDSPQVTTGVNDTKISRQCPTTHPISLPSLMIELRWSSDLVGSGTGDWYLSSDDTDGDGTPDVPGGTTSYAGWMSSWDTETADTWVENCIQVASHCFRANLGDGTRLT